MTIHGATGAICSHPSHAREASGRPPRTVLVVDGQAMFRSALCWALFKASPDARIVEIDDQADLCIRLERSTPLVIVLLEDQTGDSIAALGRSADRSQLIVLIDDELERPWLSSPAFASATVLSRSLPLSDIVEQVDCALSAADTARLCGSELRRPKPQPLTRAQSKVLAAAGTGLLNKQIAFEMGITEATVKAHMSAILRKLSVQNRMQAINIARRDNPTAFPVERSVRA